MIKVYRLPFRAGAAVALTAAIAVWLVSSLVAPIPGWTIALCSLILGAAGYLIVRILLVKRLQDLERLLKAIESRSFDEVEDPGLDGGDELARLGQLVRRSGTSVMEEMDQMKKMESYRRDFIGNVSHELKTPIFAIKGFSETLLGGALDDSSVNRSFLEKILRNTQRLENLARDLLEISRIETGELKMEMAPFRVDELIREVIESLEPRAEQKQIVLEPVLPGGLPRAEADEERIRQVLINLIDNAIKYSNHGGRVEVVARFVEPSSVKISVVDDGIGVSAEHILRLTERFYRVDKSRSRSQGGTGLGLSIVKHILGAHGKKLQVRSSEGNGSTFGFTLDGVTVSEPLDIMEPVAEPA